MNGMNEETRNSVYRILDASANRAGEGLRTMEEIARFVLDDSKLRSLGWKSKINFDKELINIVKYYENKFIW